MTELLNTIEAFTPFSIIKELLIAFIIALPIGWNRELESRSMGLRTFPLVALASCGYMLLGSSFIGDDSPDAIARLLTGLMTGIGFIGGGAILKDGGSEKVLQLLRVSGQRALLVRRLHSSAMRLPLPLPPLVS